MNQYIEFSWGLRNWRVLRLLKNKALVRCTTYDYSSAFWLPLEDLDKMMKGLDFNKEENV